MLTGCTPQLMLAVHRDRNPDGPFQPALCRSPEETGSTWDCAPGKVRQLRREANAANRRQAAYRAAHQHDDLVAAWLPVARCESGDNVNAVSPSGTYRGWLQFDQASWQANGGQGDPLGQPREVAARVAENYRLRSGTSPWPVCGRYYG